MKSVLRAPKRNSSKLMLDLFALNDSVHFYLLAWTQVRRACFHPIKLQAELVFHKLMARERKRVECERRNHVLPKSIGNCSPRVCIVHAFFRRARSDDKTSTVAEQKKTKHLANCVSCVSCKPIKCAALQLKCWYLRKFFNCKRNEGRMQAFAMHYHPFPEWHTQRIRARKSKRAVHKNENKITETARETNMRVK